MHFFWDDHDLLTEILMPEHLNTVDILQLSRINKTFRTRFKHPAVMLKWMKPRPSCLLVLAETEGYVPTSP